MRKLLVFFCAMVLVFGAVGTANASLTTIGTATYNGSDYNLIYEDDGYYGGLVWMDYTNDRDIWQNQMDWAAALNATGVLTYNLNPDVRVTWGDEWRLPLVDESQCNLFGSYGYEGPNASGYHDYEYGFNMVNSEVGHLFYESLGNLGRSSTDGVDPQPGWGFNNSGDFQNIPELFDIYWMGTEFSLDPTNAWHFFFGIGGQSGWDGLKDDLDLRAMAVRPATFSAVPIPSAIWLLGSGLIGLVGFRKKFKKERHHEKAISVSVCIGVVVWSSRNSLLRFTDYRHSLLHGQ